MISKLVNYLHYFPLTKGTKLKGYVKLKGLLRSKKEDSDEEFFKEEILLLEKYFTNKQNVDNESKFTFADIDVSAQQTYFLQDGSNDIIVPLRNLECYKKSEQTIDIISNNINLELYSEKSIQQIVSIIEHHKQLVRFNDLKIFHLNCAIFDGF